jgi:hypothetical protein
LIGLQYHDEIAASLQIEDRSAAGFASLLGALAAGQGEAVEIREEGDAASVIQTGWRLMAGIASGAAMFPAWNALWEGMLAVHNRGLVLSAERSEGGVRWTIAPRN